MNKSDITVADQILSWLYYDGDCLKVPREDIIEKFPKINPQAINRILHEMRNTFIYEDVEFKSFSLSKSGVDLMRNHGSYSAYVKYRKPSKRWFTKENLGWVINNLNLVIAMIIAIYGIRISAKTQDSKEIIQRIEEKTKAIQSALDSLKSYQNNIQPNSQLQKEPLPMKGKE